MLEYDPGVTSDSPAGTDVQEGAPSAETLNTGGQPAPPAPPQHTVPYERFHEVNTGFRNAEARAAAAEQAAHLQQQQLQQANERLAALEQRLTAQANQVPRTPEEAQQRQLAIRALKELQAEDPDHAQMLKLAKAAPALAQAVLEAQRQIAEIRQGTTLSFARSEEGRLHQLATTAGIPVATPQQFQALNNYVTGIIRSNPQAMQAFQNGDATVLPWALGLAKQDYDAQRQAARAQTSQTKTQLGKLPPRIGGGPPGTPPPPRYDPKDPRGSMAKIHTAAEDFLAQHAG